MNTNNELSNRMTVSPSVARVVNEGDLSATSTAPHLDSKYRRGNRKAKPLMRDEDSFNESPLIELASLQRDSVQQLQDSAFSANTRRSYTTSWTAFSSWCEGEGFDSLPASPIAVSAYLARAANFVNDKGSPFYAVGSLQTWLSSINKAHFLAGFPEPGAHPEVKLLMAGIARERARPIARRAPLLLQPLRQTLGEIEVSTLPSGPIGHRDRAILLFGFVGAYRRSELASLKVGDVERNDEDGLHVFLAKSKTDKSGEGLTKALPFGGNTLTCAPCAFVRWIRVLAVPHGDSKAMARFLRTSDRGKHVCREPLPELGAIPADTPLFRPVMKNGVVKERHISGGVVYNIVKSRMANANLDSQKYGAHSLRAGFVTQAFRDGATHHEVMRQTGHRTVQMVELYSRENNPLLHNAVTKLHL